MVKCYLVSAIDIEDREVYVRDYTRPTFPTIQAAGGVILAVDDEASLMEGQKPGGRIVLIEFPDREAAESWYRSDEYRRLTKVRQSSSTERFVVFADGVTQNAVPHDRLEDIA